MATQFPSGALAVDIVGLAVYDVFCYIPYEHYDVEETLYL